MAKFEMTEQDQIEQYAEISREFFRDVLDMDLDECLISDESALSDFSSCGLPEDGKEYDSLKDLYAAWDVWVTKEIESRYGFRLEKTSVYLVTLFEQIRISRNQSVH